MNLWDKHMTTGRINQVLPEDFPSGKPTDDRKNFNQSKLCRRVNLQHSKSPISHSERAKSCTLSQSHLASWHRYCKIRLRSFESIKLETLPLRLPITPSVQTHVFTLPWWNNFHQHRQTCILIRVARLGRPLQKQPTTNLTNSNTSQLIRSQLTRPPISRLRIYWMLHETLVFLGSMFSVFVYFWIN